MGGITDARKPALPSTNMATSGSVVITTRGNNQTATPASATLHVVLTA